eukprot:gene8248-9096_t
MQELPLLSELPGGSDEGYAFAFSPKEENLPDVVRFFQEYGYVVIRDLYDAEDCRETRDAMWEVLEQENPGMSRSDARTWNRLKAKGQYGLSIRGPSFHRTFLRNRQHPMLAKILSQLCEAQDEKDVIVSQDRFTVYRATQSDDPEVQAATFTTGEPNLHLDLNPWWHGENPKEVIDGIDTLTYQDSQDYIRENNLVVGALGRHVQCVLNFEDNLAEDGGTLVVPYFHEYMSQWAAEHLSLRKQLPWVSLPKDVERDLLPYAHRVPMRQGSVLFWDQRMIHGTSPNRSKRCRMAMYLKAGPRSLTYPCKVQEDKIEANQRLVRRAQGILREVQGDVNVVSPLGWHLFGLDVVLPYPQSNATIPE